MKSKIIVLLIVLTLFTGSLFADTGIGAAFGWGANGMGSAALSLDVDKIPGSVQTISINWGNDLRVNLTDDWYIIDDVLSGPFGWYFGLGFYASIGSVSNDLLFSGGARAPIGVDLTLLDNVLLFYIEAAPQLGVRVAPSFQFPEWDVVGSLGFRVYF